MLPLMAVLVWAVCWVGGLQLSAQQMSQASRKAAMSGALGRPVSLGDSTAGARLTKRVAPLQGVAVPRVAILQDEWFGTGLGLLSVHARTAPSPRIAGLEPPITRHTRVAVGAGHAHGDSDARRRIGNAPTAWRQAERDSLAQARRVGALAQRVDGPWGRPSLQTDWLSAWADVVPAQRLTNRKEQAR